MEECVWYYPKDINELTVLLEKDAVIPHGGGTRIVQQGLKKAKGLISLDGLGLAYFHNKDKFVEIGATLT
jgi:CO/xanthine dehydrogenase FAD-binding subunit